MRRLGPALLAIFCVAPLLVHADGNKQLQSVKGTVSYEHGKTSKHTLAQSATIVLADSDFAVTGDASIGAVVLPESSRVTMGSDTRVQLAFFNQIQSTNAKFIIYQGRTRFKIEHPNGKPANYTFQTPTAQIAVRGTEGDIGVDGQDLTVNVYGLTDPNLPVIVTTEDGKKYALKAGQHLLASWVNGHIQTTIDALTDQAMSEFAELGAPVSNWQSAVANLGENVTGGLIPSGIAGGISSLFGRHAQSNNAEATAAPNASPTPCATPKASKLSGFLHKITNSDSQPSCASPSPSPSPSGQ
jgi:hypothetical protein